MLRALTDGRVTGSGTIVLTTGVFGGALISSNGTNAAVVTVWDEDGQKIFDVSAVTPPSATGAYFSKGRTLTYTISGTGAAAILYESV